MFSWFYESIYGKTTSAEKTESLLSSNIESKEIKATVKPDTAEKPTDGKTEVKTTELTPIQKQASSMSETKSLEKADPNQMIKSDSMSEIKLTESIAKKPISQSKKIVDENKVELVGIKSVEKPISQPKKMIDEMKVELVGVKSVEKPILQIDKDKFAILLMTLPAENKLDEEELFKISEKNDSKPILISHGSSICVFGNSDGTEWKITELNSIAIPKELAFPVDEAIISIDGKDIPSMIFKEITTKKAHTPILSTLTNLARNSKNLQRQLKEQLKDMLEPEAYKTVLDTSISATDKSDLPIFYYKNAIRLLGEFCDLLKVYEKLHLQFLEIKKNNYWVTQAVTALYNKYEIVKIFEELFDKQTEFDDTMVRIGLDQLQLRLPNSDDFDKLLKFILPMKVIEKAKTENPIIKSFKSVWNNSTENKADSNRNLIEQDPSLAELISRMHSTAKKVNAVLSKLAKEKNLDDDAKLEIMRSIAHIEIIMEDIREFSKTGKGLFATLKFAFNVRSKVMALLANISPAMSSVKGIIRDLILDSLEQLNTIFREIALHADKIEIAYHLKEGYLTNYQIKNYSITGGVYHFNKLLERLNYEFKEEDRYPYTQAMFNQRLALSKHPESLSSITCKILQTKIKSSIGRSSLEKVDKELKKIKEINQNYTDKYAIVNDILSRRIAELMNEKRTEIKTRKIKLLARLKIELIDNNKSFDEAISILKDPDQNPIAFQHTYLLWDGRTRNSSAMIRELLSESPTRIDLIELKIQEIREKISKKYFFESDSKIKTLTQRMEALENLKKFLLPYSGYRLKDALNVIDENRENNKRYYDVLDKNDKTLLKQIEALDRMLPNYQIGKTVINQFPLDSKLVNENSMDPNRQEKIKNIDNQIELLKRELNRWDSKFFSHLMGNVKKDKILVLQLLKYHLVTHPDTALSILLDQLPKSGEYKTKIHYLYEGRTGHLVKHLLNQDLTHNELIHILDLNLVQLRQQLEIPFRFCEKSKKMSFTLHISALEKLKRNIMNGYPLFTNLSHKEMTILQMKSRNLIVKVEDWLSLHPHTKMLNESTDNSVQLMP